MDALARRISVRAHELAPLVGELEHNLAMVERAIDAAVQEGIELLVLPELVTSGYYLRTEEARAVAIGTDHPVFAHWASKLPDGMVVVFGFCELDGDLLYNSAAVLGSGGLLSRYRKTHLWDAEKTIFTPGEEAAPVVHTPVGEVGVMICYDLEFPEMPRSVALRGAEIIAVPTNWPYVEKPAEEHAPEVVQAMAAARSSTIPIVCCDRAGDERGNTWTQGTVAIGADGWPTGVKDGSGRVDASIGIHSERTSIGPRNDVLADRRPSLYQ